MSNESFGKLKIGRAKNPEERKKKRAVLNRSTNPVQVGIFSLCGEL